MLKNIFVLFIMSLIGLSAQAQSSATQSFSLSLDVNQIQCATRTVSCSMTDSTSVTSFTPNGPATTLSAASGLSVTLQLTPICSVSYSCSNGQTYPSMSQLPVGSNNTFDGNDNVIITGKAISTNSGTDVLVGGNRGLLKSANGGEIQYAIPGGSFSNNSMSLLTLSVQSVAPENGSYSDTLTVTITGQ